jgi:hypothetical protein
VFPSFPNDWLILGLIVRIYLVLNTSPRFWQFLYRAAQRAPARTSGLSTLDQAKKIKEWDALHRAAAEKLAEQQLFIAWWAAKVQGPGEVHKKEGRDLGLLVRADAERLTGMKQQRVSELGKRLEDEAD